jgi:glycosyltransferase involved in cell wall biosynthesis
MAKRILYLQFTNPAGYPPLEHGSRILADAGWSVTFLGAGAFGAARKLRFAEDPRIRVKAMPYARGALGRKLAYLVYCGWALAHAVARRPRWIYASDPLACLPALLCAAVSRASLVYHEHDSPPPPAAARGLRMRLRDRVARTARLCVLPNAERATRFERETGTRKPVLCVWNCPARSDVATRPPPPRMLLFYHGSLNAERLPFTVLLAMATLPEHVRLHFAGYATAGSPSYPGEFLAEAARLGLAARVRFLGTLGRRSELLAACREATVGLALMPMATSDPNLRAMAGASNKPFDYLACGLALVVSDLPEWRAMFVEPGYALACNPGDARSIAAALARLDADAEGTARMAERGARRILEDWNYESQFAPVMAAIGNP